MVLKPASSAVGSFGSFLRAAYCLHKKKRVFFAPSTSPLPRVRASQGTYHKSWRVYTPLTLEFSLPSLAPRWFVSRGLAWDVGAWLISASYSSDRRPAVLYRKKLIQEWPRPPRTKRDLETQTTYSPQTWQRGLYAQWSIHLPKFGRGPCPVRRGHVAAVKCSVRKPRFLRCPDRLWNNTRRQGLVWVSTPQRRKPA